MFAPRELSQWEKVDELSKKGVALFEAHPNIEVDVNTGLKPEQLAEIIGQYDGLVVRSATKVTPAILEAAGKLKIVGRAGIVEPDSQHLLRNLTAWQLLLAVATSGCLVLVVAAVSTLTGNPAALVKDR